MKTEIDDIKRHLTRIRRNPDMAPTMVALALDAIATALEKIDDRMTKIETAMPRPITQGELDEFIRQQPATTGGYMAAIPAGRIRPEADADWQVGSKF